MKLGLNIGYSGAHIAQVRPLVEHADRIGVDSVWAAEAYGSDAVTVLSYLAACTQDIELGSAVLQMPARTPANTAMTAMTLDALCAGRFRLGLGLSGPQVVEGWHGVAYGRPLTRTREYVEIVRRAVARDEPLTYDGREYQIPYEGEDATGVGKPLRSILHPVRSEIPIYLASIGPRNVELTAEIGDGWLPAFYSPEREDVFADALEAGAATRVLSSELDIAPSVSVVIGDDVAACRDQIRPLLALYLGGMGSRDRNFYNDLAVRYGYDEAAATVQDLYLEGRKEEAAAAVPDGLVDEVALVGPLGRVEERIAAWRASRVTTLIVVTHDPDVLESLRGMV